MTGKVIDSSAGALVLILPLAMGIVILLQAWPYLLLLLVLSIAFKLWQTYQWRQWSQKINPYFTQLIKENQGCLTPLDLSLKANLTARAAKRFLETKAEEYGAQKKNYRNKGVVYYFLTASALDSIFEESEPTLEFDEVDVTDEEEDLDSSPVLSSITTVKSPKTSATPKSTTGSKDQVDKKSKIEAIFAADEDRKEEQITEEEHLTSSDNIPEALIQAELAKRLDINPSTVGRRKIDADFSEWSQSKDPEGIAWQYVPKKKVFIPLKITDS